MLDRPENLATLMRAANRGDPDAYRRVLEKAGRWLRAVVRRALDRANRGPEDAEDIVQETLLAIHLKRHTWDERQPLEPWLRAIARHKLIDHLRRRGFRDHVDIADYADELADPRTAEVARQLGCRDLMSCLTERQRNVVEGISVEGRSAREVGEQLGMSEGAVRVALHRALKVLATTSRRGEA